MKKTGGELEVITRRPHRDREHFPTDPNLERFFSSQIIREASLESVIPFDDLGRLETLRRMAHR
jgi:hypothetical protein